MLSVVTENTVYAPRTYRVTVLVLPALSVATTVTVVTEELLTLMLPLQLFPFTVAAEPFTVTDLIPPASDIVPATV